MFLGTLQSVDMEKNTITVRGGTNIRSGGPVEKTISVAEDTVILRDAKEARLADMKPGGRVAVQLAADEGPALSISETGKTMMAALKSVDMGKNSLTVTIAAGGSGGLEQKDSVYELATDCKVTLASAKATLADLNDMDGGTSLELTFSVEEKKLIHIQYGKKGNNPK